MATANDPVVDLVEAQLDALFRGPRERFVADRNAAAKQLGAQGHPQAASRLRTLAKPSVSAWVANQLWWRSRPEMEALFDASRRLVAAMREGPAAQAAALRARRRALDALDAAACDVLQTTGHSTATGMLRRIGTTLEALGAHAVLGDGPVPGRLIEDLDPPGFERLVGLGPLAFAAQAEPDAKLSSDPDPEASAVALAEREHHAAAEQAKAAAQRLDEATRSTDELVLAAQHAAKVYEEARVQADAARQRADEAERVALRTHAESRRGRARVEEARKSLAACITELDRRAQVLGRARRR